MFQYLSFFSPPPSLLFFLFLFFVPPFLFVLMDSRSDEGDTSYRLGLSNIKYLWSEAKLLRTRDLVAERFE